MLSPRKAQDELSLQEMKGSLPSEYHDALIRALKECLPAVKRNGEAFCPRAEFVAWRQKEYGI